MGRCCMPKQHFIAKAGDLELHAIIWHVITMKLNIVKKITGLRN